ncbi:MAG: helix-turn-helix domain-containing protein [Pseudomonadota bacterium]
MKSRSKGYGQYCPLALAAELLCKRWTLLVVSRLLDGCATFSEIQKGLPRISPSLLSQRLRELEHAELVLRLSDSQTSDRHHYQLTEAGQSLNDIVDQLAIWGQHWARDNEMDDLDIEFLAWSMSTRLNPENLPKGRTVMEFEFSGAHSEFQRFWLVHTDGETEMCVKHPGFDTDVLVQSDIRRFVETWRGFRDLRTEIAAGHIRLQGPKSSCRDFPNWLALSGLAPFERKKPGNECEISKKTG